MRRFIVNALFKRGASFFEEMVGKAVRHGMTTYGGMLMAAGYADSSQVEAIIGGLVAVAGVALSAVRPKIQAYLLG